MTPTQHHITSEQARHYKHTHPTIDQLRNYDMAPNTISYFLAYDSLRRKQWADSTGWDTNESYRVWGDDDLKNEWVRYVKTRTIQGGKIYRSLLACLIYDDKEPVADFIKDRALTGQLFPEADCFPRGEDPFIESPIEGVPERDPSITLTLDEVISSIQHREARKVRLMLEQESTTT